MAGLVLMFLKLVLIFGYVWIVCLFGIIGVEVVRLGDNIVSISHLPSNYYGAAAWMSLCVVGLVQFSKKTSHSEMFGHASQEIKEEQSSEGKEEK